MQDVSAIENQLIFVPRGTTVVVGGILRGMVPCVSKIVDRKAKCRCPLQAPKGSWHSLAADPSLRAPPGNDPRALWHWLRILPVLGPAGVSGGAVPRVVYAHGGCAHGGLCPGQHSRPDPAGAGRG